jgi:membrane protease YdiL (CAAX protease family)
MILGPGQLVFGVPFLLGSIAITGQWPTDPALAQAALLEFSLSEPGLLAQLLATAAAMGLAAAVAWLWPRFWAQTTGERFDRKLWLGTRDPILIKMWMVPVGVVLMLSIVALITAQLGEANVESQLALFSSPTLAILAGMVVASVVPFAEEFVFRGALYNAVLPDDELTAAPPERRQHAPAIVVSMVAFAALHLVAGFSTITAILSIIILSVFLTVLRTLSDSVWPSVMAHMLWNAVAAMILIANTFGLTA